ncbi:hypothetical protein QUW13_09770 [Enterococcus hirae]|jgi:hypothetical protein|nr:hypothetical protein [Enterococcaceae bacterium]MCI1918738.1 hypothetical protein [Enterococcaceae bacterium]MDM8214169.1 hypothetical protein [Enterococcus hirae]
MKLKDRLKEISIDVYNLTHHQNMKVKIGIEKNRKGLPKLAKKVTYERPTAHTKKWHAKNR